MFRDGLKRTIERYYNAKGRDYVQATLQQSLAER